MTGSAQEIAFETRLDVFPLQQAEIGAQRVIGYRATVAREAARSALPVVLLHGIGSGAASWVQQLEALGNPGNARAVYAWDAPGYGVSTPVSPASPQAGDYVEALAAWLDALGLKRIVLVGHSLGAIIAGAFAQAHPSRVAGLLLISPAAGYGKAEEAVRIEKRDNRLAMVAELGPQGLAEKRAGNMLSPQAGEAARAWVRWNMSRIVPAGYAQATHLLANADLAGHVAQFAGPIAVAVGAQDAITPPAGCGRIAEAARTTLRILPGAGHAGYIEAPEAYTALIDAFCQRVESAGGLA